MNRDSLSSFVRSKMFAGVIIGIALAFIAACIFEAGVAVGYHEADFSSRFGENYTRNFGGSSMLGLPDEHTPTADGTFGKILSVSSSTIVIDNAQKPEQEVVLGADTIIRDQQDTVTSSNLSIGSYVVVLGSPNAQGEIEAKLIRIVPAPGGDANTTDTSP